MTQHLGGVFSGPFFGPKPPSNEISFPDSRQRDSGKEEPIINIEELSSDSPYTTIKARVVGIVSLIDLNLSLQADGNYRINTTLLKRLHAENKGNDLPEGFENQHVLPFGTGVAFTEELVLTAGHNVRTSPDNIRVVQYDLSDKILSKESVYEIADEYVDKRDYFDKREGGDPTTYATNFFAGDWAILKLKRPLKGIKGSLDVVHKESEFKEGLKTITLGHPHGMPLKQSKGEIEKILNKHIIRYSAKTLGGMSGGPVFCGQTKKLFGLHVRGNVEAFVSGGAIQYVVMAPIHPKMIEMGIYGTFFQNIIPVIEKIAKSNIPLQSIGESKVREIFSLPAIAFGKGDWAKHFGDIDLEPLLPSNINQILSSPCPIWAGKTIAETHMLILIPEKLNVQPLTLKSLGELVSRDFPNAEKSGYQYVLGGALKEYSWPVSKSYWVLMTREILPNSNNKPFDDQKSLLEKVNQVTKYQYAVPKLLETAICILMNYYRSGKKERLFSNDPRIETRCEEVSSDGLQKHIGNFSVEGLGIGDLDSFFGDECLGIAGVHRLH